MQEAEKLQGVFDEVVVNATKFDSPCEVLKVVAEVIKASDVEFLSLELHRLMRRLVCLISFLHDCRKLLKLCDVN